MKSVFILLIQSLIILSFPAFTQENWSFLNTQSTGAARFLKNNPQANGNSVLIFILDSGVDVSTPGLQYLPDGSVKIIDVLDYSGEGDIYLDLAETGGENNEGYLKTIDGYRIFGFDKLQEQAADSIYYIGTLDEYSFRNNDVQDINGNGQTDDRFAILLFQDAEGNWITYMDLDGDGNITDEKKINDYAVDQQPLKLRGYDKKYNFQPLGMALKIYPDQQKVNLHFDASGHGTHVAGIAAGYKINNQPTLNGVAPGAQIISMKIGNSRYSGASTTTGAMRDAFDFIADYASHSRDAIVVNMSYGIGSEIEGHADIEYYINDILSENENIVLCVSGGNKGPGLSTIGLPAAAKNAITVGAMNDAENARDIYGGNISKDKIYNFSSRGCEVAKPDVIAPGAASSTVPAFTTKENKRGTSMASPQVAGAAALLISAAKKDFPDLPVKGYKVKKALLNSAVALKGYTLPDQGNGLINIPEAYKYLMKYLKTDEIIRGYEVNTVSPFYESGYGSTLFWRYGTFYPTQMEKQSVYINPLFSRKTTAEQKNKFYKAFSLSSTTNWLKTVQSNIYLKGTSPAEIEVYLDKGKLKQPGLYSAQIIGYEKTGLFSSNSKENVEFRVWCNVIVPQLPEQFKNNLLVKKNIKLAPGDLKREFIQVSPNHTAFSIRTRQKDSEYAHIRTYVYDPYGKVISPTAVLNTEYGDEKIKNISGELFPGIWEVVFYAPFTNSAKSVFNYEFAVSELNVLEGVISKFSVKNGDPPSASFTVINNSSDAQKMSVAGSIKGIQRVVNINNAFSTYEYSFFVGDLYSSVEFEIELNREVYNKLTDFTINIKNFSGKVLKTTALGYRSKKVTFIPPSSGNYILELVPAFALQDISWQAKLTESYFYFDPNYIRRQNEMFYPAVSKIVDFSLTNQLKVAPNGYYLFGELWLNATNQNFIRNVIPIQIPTSLK